MGTEALALAGQSALVTGGARRVGAEIVKHLHAAGATVAIHYRNSGPAAQALAGELNAQRANSAAVFGADLLQTESIPALVSAVTERCGGLHILVNNASSFYPTPLAELTIAQWAELMGSNLQAPLFLAQAAAAALQRARGVIINIVDIHGLRPLPGYIAYSTAKAALIHLTKALARELAPDVRVNGIAPGPVLWPESGVDAAQRQEIINSTLLQRAGTPADVARAVCFFASAAPFVTGQILAIDGGRSLRW
ncbi:MAG TPA: pteridine reductase [Steroidobacteraceae bacterium]|nr:pteridine reductase [Steroidobacteraceae bacterium]